MPINTFIRWENVMDILTHYGENNSFMETFKHTANNEKVNLCMQNEFIRYLFCFHKCCITTTIHHIYCVRSISVS